MLTLTLLMAMPADWPRFLGPSGDGSSSEKILVAWPKDGLKKLWDCSLGESYGPPSVSEGKLYHFDIVGKNAVLACRDAATGKHLWSFEYPCGYRDQYGYDGTRCCPVIDGDRVYIYGPDGVLHCVTNGKSVWNLDTAAKWNVIPNFFGVSSVPLVEGDTLILAVGGSPKGQAMATLADVKPNASIIAILDKLTGAVKAVGGDELASFTSPLVVEMNKTRIGLYLARGGLHCFDPVTAKPLFHQPWRSKLLESALAANPLVVGNQILISESYERGSVLLRWQDGKLSPVWSDLERDREDKALMAHWATPIHHDGFVYGCSGRHSTDADIRCFKLSTGEVQWRERRTTRCTFLKADGHLLSLSEQGELRLLKLNPAKYEEVARFQTELDYPSWAPPVLADGRLFVRGKDKLVCYQIK